MYQQRLKQLKDRRQYLNYTLEQLAHLIGVSDKMIGKWERAEAVPNMMNFEAWCNALDLTVILSAETSCVDDWQPNTDFINELKQLTRGINYEYEIANFRDWYKSKGERSADWNALFRMWIRRSQRFNNKATNDDANNTEILSTVAERMHADKNI